MGGFQCVVGAIASTFAYAIYASASVREELSISQGEVALFMFVFLVFGVFSIVSGMILMHEKC
jgi:uncharacterized protein with PQ loop repeat